MLLELHEKCTRQALNCISFFDKNKIDEIIGTFVNDLCELTDNYLNQMVRLAGFEPATTGAETQCYIQLSHRRIFEN